MLLLHVKGPMGYDDLRGQDGSFRGKAQELGLIEDHMMWVDTIIEAFGTIPGFGRRFGFLGVLFARNAIPNAQLVLDMVLANSQDFLKPRNMNFAGPADVRKYVLQRLEYIFRVQNVHHEDGQTCCEALGLQAPPNFALTEDQLLDSIFLAGEFRRNVIDDDDDLGPPTLDRYQQHIDDHYHLMTAGQLAYTDMVHRAAAIRRGKNGIPTNPHIFMLTGDGGTGKTFATNVNLKL